MKKYILIALMAFGFMTTNALAGNVQVVEKFYNNTNDATVYKTSSSWATTREAISGTAVINDASSSYPYVYYVSGSDIRIYRALYQYDTSSLPDNCTINSVTANYFVQNKLIDFDDGYDFCVVVDASQATNGAYTSSDFSKCGDPLNPVEGSNRLDFSDATTMSYNELTLNDTGLGWISKTGLTKLGLREGHDVLNVPLTSVGRNYLEIRTDESTNDDCSYLSITYICDELDAPVVGGNVISVTPVTDPDPDPPVDPECSIIGNIVSFNKIADINTNSNEEMVTLGVDSDSNVVVCIKDRVTDEFIKSIIFFDSSYTPVSMEILSGNIFVQANNATDGLAYVKEIDPDTEAEVSISTLP